MTTYSFILNSSNLIGQGNNTFRYNFKLGSFTVPEGAEMSISQVTIPYSWYNITSNYGNNSFSYTLYQGATPTAYVVPITLNDGFYIQSDFNNAIISSLKANSFYFYNSLNNVYGGADESLVYPISFASNASQYTNAFTFQYIPPADPTAIAVSTSNINGFLLTFGSAQTTVIGAIYQVSGSGIPTGTYFIASSTSTTTANINTSLAVTSSSITYQRKFVWELLGVGWVWAAAGQSNSGQVTTGVIAYSPTVTIPQVNGVNVTASTYGIGNILGFTNGVYPPTYQTFTSPATVFNSTPFSINGNTLKTYTYPVGGTIAAASPPFPAIGSLVNGLVIHCNLVANDLFVPSDILDSCPITSTFASNINYFPISNAAVSMRAGTYNSILVSFSDQNLNTINANDPNVLISLIVTFPSKK